MQAVEGLHGLVHIADFHLTGEKARGLQHEGQQVGNLGDACVEAVEAEAAEHNLPAVVDDVGEVAAQVAPFGGFAVVEGDALSVVAHAHEGVAVVAVEVFVLEIELHQGEADPHGSGGGKEDEEVDKHHHAARDFQPQYAEHAGEIPEDDGEFDGGNDGADQAAHELGGGGDEILRVLLDTLVDVVGRVAAHVQAVVVFMGEPALGERGVEFFQPADHKDLFEQLVGQGMDDFEHH